MTTGRWSWVSRHILVGVSTEMLVVTLLLSWWGGLSVWAGIAVALSLIVGFRCLLALATFVVSWWFSSRNVESVPLFMHQLIGIVARETGAFLRLFFYYDPFEPFLNNHDPETAPAGGGEVPVLFVHGFYVNAGFWVEFKRYFRGRGYDAVYTMNLDPPFCDIDRFAEQLARRIGEVRAHSGYGRIVLIAQSMGGLVCRAYMDRYGDGAVERLITLGTPHQGTFMAGLLNGPNMKQMRPGNPWLESLNERQKTLSFSNHLSVHDNIVVPQDLARFPGAREVEYRELGHVSMAFSRAMMQRVFEEVVHGDRKLDKTGQSAQG